LAEGKSAVEAEGQLDGLAFFLWCRSWLAQLAHLLFSEMDGNLDRPEIGKTTRNERGRLGGQRE